MTASPVPCPPDSALVSRKQAVRLIRRRIAERTPTAVVRFGEGEARLLTADPDDLPSVKLAVRKLQKQTGLTFSTDEVLKVKALLEVALDGADVVGLGVSPRFSVEHKLWGKRIAAIYERRQAHRDRPTYLAHCMLNDDLEQALPTLLADRELVSIVSCRDLGPAVVERVGPIDVRTYPVPSQYAVRDVDGPYEARLHETPIWPDFVAGLRSALTVRERGEVFLVGAGVFAKELCVRIRDLGGIALDMGSSLDRMAGKVTRGAGRPELRSPPEVPRPV